MPSQTRKSHFRTIQKFKTDYAPVSISQYVSERTGMHVVVADQKGPKVQGYFALATEIFDDSGSPHTLEHLVFMGSKSYQYKGLLDKARRLLYPENVGFRYETGGLMPNLRVLTADRIREFHKEMYQPKNLCLVLVGEVDEENLLQILDDFEDTIINDIPPPSAPFKRPWVESAQPPAIAKTIVETIEFPEEDESMGDILIAMFGPDCNSAIETAALTVLLTYLAGSSVSVLENIMVEKEELASAIYQNWDARPNSVIWIQPSGVATDKLAHVEQRLFEILREVNSKPLDMKYMSDCIGREKRRIKSQAESSSSFYADGIINDFLFGKRDGSTLKDMGTLSEFDSLEKWSDEKWREFMRKWITDAPHISLLGTPSKSMSEKIKADEEARLAARRKELGPEGLAKLAEKLKDAIAKNEVEIPNSLLQKWPVPGVESIHFIESITARSGQAKKLGAPSNRIQQVVDKQASDVPLFLQFEHVPSNFVNIIVLLGTSQVATEHRPLLPLFLDNFFNTPIMKDGKKIDFETVVTQLEQDTVSYSMNGGGRIGDAEGLAIQFQVEPEKYAAAIEWIRTMMFDSLFDETRLKAGIAKILADIPEEKRSGNSMMYAVDSMIHGDKDSNIVARGTLVKAVYMKRLKNLLANEPATVIGWLEALRKSLFTFESMRTLVIADIEKLPNPVQAWKPLIAGLDTTKELLPLVKGKDRLSPDGKNPGNYGAVIVPMPTIDSSFLISSAKGPDDYNDPRLPALMVAISFLDSVEGPVWTAVRGTGLAYGANFRKDTDAGHVSFSIYRSPDVHRAFIAGKKILESYIDGTAKFEDHALEGAVSQIVCNLADEQATMSRAGQFHFVNGVVKGVDDEYDTRMLKRVREVKVEEIKGAMREILLPLFKAGSANLVATVAPIMKECTGKVVVSIGSAYYHHYYSPSRLNLT
ncbi:hypothetical protein M7I_4322 [Glarea lozoyensis 74030]|uniref:Peptidase M16 C-terminal domain-containing protein n=1 Tax=Glarea lozoyensis (strain ATCC 74030 / MF5533) TaxID=1104152 RepID=H0ENV9_GLAL7|nr:hypothetical protein M7I_4322 [Glarea lozoyensis 74030]